MTQHEVATIAHVTFDEFGQAAVDVLRREGGTTGDLCRIQGICMFAADAYTKHKWEDVFAIQDSECRCGKGLGVASPRGRKVTSTIQEFVTRHAGNECRGGSRGLRPFRRGRGGTRARAEMNEAWL